jgi:hypothetical protein
MLKKVQRGVLSNSKTIEANSPAPIMTAAMIPTEVPRSLSSESILKST